MSALPCMKAATIPGRFAKIRAMIASQESFALEKAAKKIQRILRLAHTKKTDEFTPASPTFEMTAKEASISTSSSLHSVSGHPSESALTLKEIGTMEDETLLIACFIEAMLSHGFTIDQVHHISFQKRACNESEL